MVIASYARIVLCGLSWLLLALPARATPAPQLIRVVLADKLSQVQVSGELSWSKDGKPAGSSSDAITIKSVGTDTDGRLEAALPVGKISGTRLVAEATKGYVNYGGRSYRGRLELFRGQAGGLVVLNVVALEDYLLSVVPSEMPASWPQQALQAQAVAARTFALSRIAEHRADSYDVYAGPSSQEYLGVDHEYTASTQAVQATAGQILTYNGTPITAYFFSDAGGATKDGDQPYLRSVPSLHPASPYNSWTIQLSAEELSQLARKQGVDIGKAQGVDADNDEASGYLGAITIHGSSGDCTIKANRLRTLLGLDVMRSTRAWVEGSSQLPARCLVPPPGQAAPAGTAPAMDYVSFEGFSRPWVLWSAGSAALKMRSLYAYDGETLTRCNHTVFAAVPGSSTEDAIPYVELPASKLDQGIVIHGSGYGHGLGMSQWGARKLAEDGWDYQQILLYFYTGVELENSSALPAPKASDEASSPFYIPFTPVQ
jgi:stage II sporulation protein D